MSSNNNAQPKGQPQPQPKQKPVTFCRFITLKNGRVLDAWDYGHKAWPVGAKR